MTQRQALAKARRFWGVEAAVARVNYADGYWYAVGVSDRNWHGWGRSWVEAFKAAGKRVTP